MRRKARIAFWLFAWALALPLVLYVFSPVVFSWLLENELEKRGAARITVELGYPGWHSTRVHVLALQKDMLGRSLDLTITNADVEYQIPQLFSGTLKRIHISNASLEITTKPPISPSPAPADHSQGLLEVLASTAISVGAITRPFPTLPFQELRVDNMYISHTQAPSPFQQVVASGALENKDGTLAGKFTFQGRHAPPYELTLAGKRIGDLSLLLQSPMASPQPVISVTSALSQSESGIHVQGTVHTDIKELSAFLALFLPIGDLEKAAGRLTVDWRGSSPENVSSGSLVTEQSAAVRGKFRLELNTPQLSPHLTDISLLISGSFRAGAGQVAWSLDGESGASASIDLEDISLPDEIRDLFPGKRHHVSINLPRAVSGQLSVTDHRPRVSVDGTIRARYGSPRTPLELMMSISNPSGELQGPGSGRAMFNLSGALRGQRAKALPVRSARWDLTGDMSLESDQLRLVLNPPSLLRAALVQVGATTVPHALVTVTKPLALVYQLHTGTWKAEPALLRIQAPQVQWDQQTFSIQETTLRVERLRGGPSTWNAEGELTLVGLSTRMGDLTPPATNWTLEFSANPSGILIDWSGRSADGVVSAKGRLKQDFSTQEGVLQIRVFPITFSSPSFVLSKLIQPWRYPFDIASGAVSARGNVSWKLTTGPSASAVAVKHAEATIALEHISGHYKKIIFHDLNTTLRVAGGDRWGMPKPATITLRELKAGLDIQRIAMNFQIRPNPLSSSYLVTIRDFSSHLLGGRASSGTIALEVPLIRSALSVELQHLDLEEIFELEQQEGLRGTGLLDGILPLTITRAGIEVHKGKLEARPPGGRIHFQPSEQTAESLSQISPNMGLVLQALRNFRYRVLKIDLDYARDGRLTLQVRLEGRNPDLQKGRPIHFNLNIEENIPALIKTLRLVRGIEEQIQHMYQRR